MEATCYTAPSTFTHWLDGQQRVKGGTVTVSAIRSSTAAGLRQYNWCHRPERQMQLSLEKP